MDPWRSRVVTLADGRALSLAEFGPADGFPILWFHGTPGARRQVPPAAIEFADATGVRIIGVERPGVGHSSPHHYDRISGFAAEVEQVVLDLAQKLGDVGIDLAQRQHDAEGRIGLVDVGVGAQAGVGLGRSAEVRQRGGAVVAGSGIDAGEVDHGSSLVAQCLPASPVRSRRSAASAGKTRRARG